MADNDPVIRDLQTSLDRLREEHTETFEALIHWRGLARALAISLSTSYAGPVSLEREDGDRYRRAVWILASWIYASTVDRCPNEVTPDSWVRWALEQDANPSPPPVSAVLD